MAEVATRWPRRTIAGSGIELHDRATQEQSPVMEFRKAANPSKLNATKAITVLRDDQLAAVHDGRCDPN